MLRSFSSSSSTWWIPAVWGGPGGTTNPLLEISTFTRYGSTGLREKRSPDPASSHPKAPVSPSAISRVQVAPVFDFCKTLLNRPTGTQRGHTGTGWPVGFQNWDRIWSSNRQVRVKSGYGRGYGGGASPPVSPQGLEDKSINC